MAYCTSEDVLKMISAGELAQLSADTGAEPDDAVVGEAIDKACGEIDLLIGRVHTVPLATVPPAVKSMAVDMAIYHLFMRRNIMFEARRAGYEDAVSMLKLVAAGKAGLQPEEKVVTTVEFDSGRRVFGSRGRGLF